MSKKKFIVTSLVILLGLVITGAVLWVNNRYNSPTVSKASSNTYYVSTTGLDTNDGSQVAPWKTFTYAMTKLVAGDTLLIGGGTYNQRMAVTKSGTSTLPIKISAVPGETVVIDANNSISLPFEVTGSYVQASNLTVKNATAICVDLKGNDIVVSNFNVTGCVSHGVRTSGERITVEKSTIYNTVLENAPTSPDGGWGSGLKVYVGSKNTVLKENTVYNNYGEGIAVTRGLGAVVENNTVYDNFGVNLYIDNSNNVVAQGNIVGCTTNPQYQRDGKIASGIMVGIENYSGWGDQYGNVTIRNNVVGNCRYGFQFSGPELSGTSIKDTNVYNNTFWNITQTGISIYTNTYTKNVVVANNVVHYAPNGKHAYVSGSTGLSFKNNFWVGTKVGVSGIVVGTGDLSGDVKLASTPMYNNKDSFKLSALSPAIDKGAASLVTTDMYGNSRPFGNGIDMGAHEYGSTSSTPSEPETEEPTTPTPPAPTVLELNAVQDTFVNSAKPKANFNSNTVLKTNNDTQFVSFLKYDLTSLTGKTVKSAKVMLYVSDATATSNVVSIYETANATWTGSTVTYKAQPALGSLVTTFGGATKNTWVSIDVTDLVKTKLGQLLGFGIKKSSTDLLQFHSLENTNKPKMVVEIE